MFDEKTLKKVKDLSEEWDEECSKSYGDREFNEATTGSGIKLKPVYTPVDINDVDFAEIGLPGVYPYTRGPELRGYQAQPWMMRLGFGFGTGKETHQRWEHLRKIGMRKHVGMDEEEELFPYFNMLIDLPTQHGYDADDPEARGKVGELGVSFSTVEDMGLLFDGLPLDKIGMTFILNDPALVTTALYVTYAERRGYAPEVLRMNASHVMYRQWFWDERAFPPENAHKLMVENINYRIKHIPQHWHTNISGYNPGEAGATPVQEVAFDLACARAIVADCVKAGLDSNDVARGFYYHSHVGLDLFEEVAKIRAFRRMWAKIFKEQFGCTDPRALGVTVFPQTAGLALTRQEPLNNIIRATIATLATVLAGVDSVWTSSYDEAYCIPTEEAAQIAVRTHQIIYHETNIPNVVDPLGGSYYLEWLTNKIEEEAWKLLDKVEELGGYIQCWKTGWMRAEIIRSANEYQSAIDRSEKVIVGVNKYRLEEPQRIQVFEVDPGVEQEAIERIKEFKAKRDNAKTQQALAHLRETTGRFLKDWPGSCGTLMPAILDAVRADATLGEVQRVLREVCGHVYTY